MLMYLYEQSQGQSGNNQSNINFSAKDRDLLRQYVNELRGLSINVSGGGKTNLLNAYRTHINQLTKIVAGYADQVAEMLNAHRATNPSEHKISSRSRHGKPTRFAEHGRTIFEPAIIRLL